jgi:hypothetical protein
MHSEESNPDPLMQLSMLSLISGSTTYHRCFLDLNFCADELNLLYYICMSISKTRASSQPLESSLKCQLFSLNTQWIPIKKGVLSQSCTSGELNPVQQPIGPLDGCAIHHWCLFTCEDASPALLPQCANR